MPCTGRSARAALGLLTAPPPRRLPLPLLRLLAVLVRPRGLLLATARRPLLAALERRVVARAAVLLLGGRALLAATAALAGTGVAAAALLLGVALGVLAVLPVVLGVVPAGVLELAMAGKGERSRLVCGDRAGGSVSHRAPRNQ